MASFSNHRIFKLLQQPISLLAWLPLGLFAGLWGLPAVFTPIFMLLVCAYLLNPMVVRLGRWGLQRTAAVSVLLLLISVLVSWLVLAAAPLLWQQARSFVMTLPTMLAQGQQYLTSFAAMQPEWLSPAQLGRLSSSLEQQILVLFDTLLTVSWSGVQNIFQLLAYGVLMPMMLFFLLKDWPAMKVHWQESRWWRDPQLQCGWQLLHRQWMGYIRGKLVEMLVLTSINLLLFSWYQLPYAFLLAVLVGMSVFVPYVGIILVSIPVVLTTIARWGQAFESTELLLIYLVIQLVDAYLLVPLLFSAWLNLSAFTVLLAILVFGNLGGLWGIVLAIPLASLCHVLVQHWLCTKD